MRNPAGRWTIAACSLALVCLCWWPAPAHAVTDQEVEDTIEKMKDWLYSQQDKPTGSWDDTFKDGHSKAGPSAIVCDALLAAGESSQRPELAKGLEHLASSEREGTYQVSLMVHTWAQLPPQFADPLLNQDGQWLYNAVGPSGGFHYVAKPNGPNDWDNSCSQYGLLGLWEAVKRGVPIPHEVWPKIAEHFLTSQSPDGGWPYAPNAGSSPTMTLAGITGLYVAQQELTRKSPRPDARFTDAINKGLAWLNQHYNPASPGGWPYYCLVGTERVALAGGIKEFGGHDWFSSGADFIVRAAGGGHVDNAPNTAFALIFLSRGRVPVWCTKLSIPDFPWNNRPNDIYFFNQYLSSLREGEVNWQVLSLDRPAKDLLSTPIAWLSSDQALKLTDDQKADLKRYLDLGGLLVANPEATAFSDSIRTLGEQLYPNLKWRRLDARHPIYHDLMQMDGTGGLEVAGLSNGARDLILMPYRDWGMGFQADEGDARSSPQWKAMINLFVWATDRGVLPNRLAVTVETTEGAGGSNAFVMGRPQYDGDWLPEPAAVDRLSAHLSAKAGLSVSGTPATGKDVLDLEKIGACDDKLVHLCGIKSYKLPQPQIDAIRAYLDRGGTLLVETVGGDGLFASDLESQLGDALNSKGVPLVQTPDSPILTGQGINGFDCTKVNFRRYAVLLLAGNLHQPRLDAIFINKRPAVIFSREDLTEGVVGVNHWDIMGYDIDSARNLFANIILWANQQNLTPAPK